MAINTDPRQTTAYAAQRFAPRPATGPVGREMSAKQRDFVATLVTQSQEYMRAMVAATVPQGAVTTEMIAEALSDFSPAATVRAIQDTLNQTGRNPRTVIDALVASRDALRKRSQEISRKTRQDAPQRAEDGATYRAPSGAIYHAYKGQAGHLLLKLWDAAGEVFSYYGAATRLPADSVKLSTEEMQAFGRATGTCAICMRHLTDDVSVERGIGPICAGRVGL